MKLLAVFFLLFVFFGCQDNTLSPDLQGEEANSESSWQEIQKEFPEKYDQIKKENKSLSKGFGLLFYKRSIFSPQSNILIAGSSQQHFTRFVFLSLGKNTKVEEIKLSIPQSFFPAAALVTIQYPKVHGQGTAQGYFSSTGELSFFDLDMYIKKNKLVYLDVYCDLASISSGQPSGLSGSIDLMDISTVKRTWKFPGDCQGNDMIIRKSKPYFSLLSLPSSILVNGYNTVSRVAILSEASGEVAIKQLSWEVETNATLSNYALYLAGNPAPLTATFSSSGNKVTAFLTTELTIPPGSSKELSLKAVVTGVASGSFVKCRLQSDNQGFITTSCDQLFSSDFIWSDVSSVPHSVYSEDWTNGYLLNLPPERQTLTN